MDLQAVTMNRPAAATIQRPAQLPTRIRQTMIRVVEATTKNKNPDAHLNH
jgi:hypothetical protein